MPRKLKYGISRLDNSVEYDRRRILDQMHRAPWKRILTTSRFRAKKLGLKFTITEKDLVIPTHCSITGLKLKFNLDKRQNNTYSIDRIDNSKGYIPGNVAVISWKANRIKNNLTLREIENLYKYIKKHLKKKDKRS